MRDASEDGCVRCTRCRRNLTREPVLIGGHPFGPTCSAAITGAKAPRIKREDRRSDDDRQLVFEWVRFAGTTYGVGA